MTGRSIGAIGALILVTACGKKPDAAPAAAPAAATTAGIDFCGLLTAAEIEAASGWRPTETEPIGADRTGHCIYNGPNPPGTTELQTINAGVGVCPPDMACVELPDFTSSAALAEYRKQWYVGKDTGGMVPVIEPIEGWTVPAIRHEFAGLQSIEMAIGGKRVAYVQTRGSAEAAKGLAEKVLARVRQQSR